MMMRCVVGLLALVLLPSPAPRQDKPAPQPAASDREQVIATVQKLFDGMAAHDVDVVRQVMIPEGRLFATTAGGTAGQEIRSRSNQEFMDGIAKATQTLLERMWNPEVRVRGSVATLWASYDFHVDGKFSHCGVDAFDLVKTAGGWKIAGGAYTVERTGCAPSPLGEPK